VETYFRLDLYVAGINYFMVNILLIAEGLDGDEPCIGTSRVHFLQSQRAI